MSANTSEWIVLAQLLRPQGRKGELLAELLTDFPERFKDHPRVFLAPASFAGTKEEARTAEIVDSWLPTGKNQGRIVLHFAGIDSISAAESIAGLDVIIPREERVPLDDDSQYISDMIGCAVYDADRLVGVLEDVHFPSTADGTRRLEDATPILLVQSPEGDEILIPFAKAFLSAIDVEKKRIDMTLPEGLVEINLPAARSEAKK